MDLRLLAGAGFAVVWSLFCAFLAKHELKKVYEKLKSRVKPSDSEEAEEVKDKTFDNKQMYIFGAIVTVLNVILAVVLSKIYIDIPVIEQVLRVGLVGIIEVAAVTDKKYNLIPNDLILVGLIFRGVIFIAEIFTFRLQVLSILISDGIGVLAVVIIVVLCLLFMKGSVGMGDLKIMMLMALCQGIDGFASSGMLSLLAAFFVAVYYLITKKRNRKDAMAFAPFLAIGTYLGVFLTGL